MLLLTRKGNAQLSKLEGTAIRPQFIPIKYQIILNYQIFYAAISRGETLN